jgi:hypothetical protein
MQTVAELDCSLSNCVTPLHKMAVTNRFKKMTGRVKIREKFHSLCITNI